MATMNFRKVLFIFCLFVLLPFIPNANSGVIFSDDFNDGNSNGWTICPFCGGAGMSPVVSGGYNDAYTWTTRSYWQQESDPNYKGYWDACFGDTGISGSPREVYVRYYIKFSSNWLFPTGNSGVKSFLIGYTNNGQGGWTNDPIFLLTKWDLKKPFFDMYTDPDSNNWGGIPGADDPLNRCGTQAWVNFTWQVNRWYEVELHMKQNTGSNSDGVLQAWVDGVLLIDCNHVNMGNNPKAWDRFMLTNYISGSSGGFNPNGTQIYTDNITIATERIGGGNPPKPPTGLRIVP